MKNIFSSLSESYGFRIAIMFIGILFMFGILVVKLYDLQVINGDYYNSAVVGTTLRDVVVEAPRGSVYDRYGRPLAVNKSSYSVCLDSSISVDNLNEVLYDLYNLLVKNGEEISVELPITPNAPHIFLFDNSPTKEKRWKTDMGFDEDINASEAFYKLRVLFDINDDIYNEEAAKILAFRCAMYEKRYSKYVTIPVATNVSIQTVTAIQEKQSTYPCVSIETDNLREYPAGEYTSHLLGYIGNITDSELETYQQYGYTLTDKIGKDGIEKSFEQELKGKDGIEYIEVDSLGRRIKTVDSKSQAPVAGNNVILTLDLDLQKKAFDALEKALLEAQLYRINGKGDFTYGSQEVFSSMITCDTIKIKDILASKEGMYQYSIKKYILEVESTALNDVELAKQILIDGYEKGRVGSKQLVLSMIEQKTINADEKFISRVNSGEIGPLQAVVMKMESGEITPAMTGLDPCTGSVVVTDVDTGEVLAAATYPSYDNNKLVNNFDNEYYQSLQSATVTTPLVYRPFTEPRAPGSTFKMITAVAALEEGIIGPSTLITDKGTFEDAGRPYARCWIGSGLGSHGSINISTALEVSCNYFFYQVAYNMGNAKNGETQKGIETLNKYMKAFGLNDSTGVEIYELYDATKNYPSNISSPEYKSYIYKARNPEISDNDLKWRDGDTIRTAIGQSFNNYTSAMLSKYVATLANGGTRYSMHFLNEVKDNVGNTVSKYEPVVEEKIDISKRNLDAIYKGMLAVTKGSKGTLRKDFADFPINVAAKSGTSQESSLRSEHTIFVGFAPYENPQIGVSVIIPYGTTDTNPAPDVAKEVISAYLNTSTVKETASYNVLTK